MNSDWLRWLKTSTVSVFNAYPRTPSGLSAIPLFFDNVDDPMKRKSPYYLELQISDIVITQRSKTYFEIQQTVKIAVVVLQNDTNMYTKDCITGLVSNMFGSYDVVKKGTQAGDDGAYVTCMQPDSEMRIFELGITKDRFDLCVFERDFKGNFEE